MMVIIVFDLVFLISVKQLAGSKLDMSLSMADGVSLFKVDLYVLLGYLK